MPYIERNLTYFKEEFRKAVTQQVHSPLDSLIIARRIAEEICQDLLFHELSEDSHHVMLGQAISTLTGQPQIPPYIITSLKTIHDYGNLGGHGKQRTVKYLPPQVPHLCLCSLEILLQWYEHSYQPASMPCESSSPAAIIFTISPGWQRLKYTQGKRSLPINLTIQETTEVISAKSLLKKCQTFAELFQPVPLVFVFDRTDPAALSVMNNEEQRYTCWGNQVFSLTLPIPDVSALSENEAAAVLHTICETVTTILQEHPKEIEERSRRIDAAVPGHATLEQSINLLVQVRFEKSPVLGAKKDWPSRRVPVSIEQQSAPVSLEFRLNRKTGERLPVNLEVEIVAPDFTIKDKARATLYVPPDQYSNLLSFRLIPKRQGHLPIKVNLYGSKQQLFGVLPFATMIEAESPTFDHAEAPVLIVNNLLLEIHVSDQPQAGHAEIRTQYANSQEVMRFLSDATRQEIASQLVQQVMTIFNPEMAAQHEKYTHALVAMAAQGNLKHSESAGDVAGGLGVNGVKGTAVMTKMIVTVVAILLSTLLQKPYDSVWQKVRQRIRKNNPAPKTTPTELIQQMTAADIEELLKKYGFHIDLQTAQLMTESIKQVMEKYLKELV